MDPKKRPRITADDETPQSFVSRLQSDGLPSHEILITAIRTNKIENVIASLQRSSIPNDLQTRGKDGQTAIDVAEEIADPGIIRLLSAQIKQENPGASPSAAAPSQPDEPTQTSEEEANMERLVLLVAREARQRELKYGAENHAAPAEKDKKPEELEGQILAQRKKITELEAQATSTEKLEGQIKELEKKFTELEAQATLTEELKEQIRGLKDEIASLNTQAASAHTAHQQDLSTVQDHVLRLTNDLGQQTAALILGARENSALQEEIASYGKHQDAIQQQLTDAQQKTQTLIEQKKSLTRQLTELDGTYKTLEENLKQKNAQLEDLQASTEAHKKITQERDFLIIKMRTQITQIGKQKAQLSNVDGKLKEYKSLQESYELICQILMSDLQTKGERSEETQRKLKTMHDQVTHLRSALREAKLSAESAKAESISLGETVRLLTEDREERKTGIESALKEYGADPLDIIYCAGLRIRDMQLSDHTTDPSWNPLTTMLEILNEFDRQVYRNKHLEQLLAKHRIPAQNIAMQSVFRTLPRLDLTTQHSKFSIYSHIISEAVRGAVYGIKAFEFLGVEYSLNGVCQHDKEPQTDVFKRDRLITMVTCAIVQNENLIKDRLLKHSNDSSSPLNQLIYRLACVVRGYFRRRDDGFLEILTARITDAQAMRAQQRTLNEHVANAIKLTLITPEQCQQGPTPSQYRPQ